MSRIKYEYGRPRKGDTTSYGFSSNRHDAEEEDEGAGTSSDFWKDLRSEDEAVVDGNEKNPKNFAQTIRKCGKQLIAFYRPTLSESSVSSSAPGEFDFATDLDFTTTSNAEREMRNLYYQLRLGSSILVAVSLFFWAWAVKNTEAMESGQDLGMYSFLTTLASSHYVLWRTRKGPTSGILVATLLSRVLVTASHVLVCLNYCLGVLFAYTVGSNVYYNFGGYCLVFSGLWGYVAFKGFMLFSKLQANEANIATRSDDGDEEDFEDEYF
jgi:hypothetical protein